MSRSYAIVGTTTFAGVRLDGYSTYIPAHIRSDGKRISAQCIMNAYANLRKRGQQAEGKRMRFRFTAWGKLADACARIGHAGMALDITAQAEAYKARVWVTNAQNQRVALTDASGAEIKTWEVGFKIVDIQFAEESGKHIDTEIQEAKRPQFWNVKGHQHYTAWSAEIERRKNNVLQFHPSMTKFGEANVYLPAGCTIDYTDPNAVQQQPVQGAPVTTMVQHAVNTQPVGNTVDPNAALNGGGAPVAPAAPMAPVNGYVAPQGV